MKTPKSETEIQVEEELTRMEQITLGQKVTVKDANKLITKTYKILHKCEELRISRDNHKEKRRLTEEKLKELKKQLK